MFRDIERKIIASQSKKDIEYWPLLKHEICIRKSRQGGGTDFQYKSPLNVRLFIALLLSLLNLLIACITPHKTAFFGASSRAIIKNNKITDEFLSENQLSSCILLYHCSNYEKICLKTVFKKKVIFENLIMKLYTGVKGLFINKRSISHNYLSVSTLNLVKQEYGLDDVDLDIIFFNFECKIHFYTLLLRMIKINKLYLISSYTKTALVSSANNLKISTLEYQHGVVAPYHPSYYYTGKNVWDSTLLPTALCLSSSFWLTFMKNANFVSKLSVNESTLVKYDGKIKLDDFCRSLRDKGDYVIFTGQGISYDDVFDFIREFLNVNPELNFIYRPHPREHLNYRRYTENILSSNFFVVDRDSYQDTKQLILGAKAHISIFSSCHFEAIELLNKTYVLDILDDNVMAAGKGDANIIFFKKAHELSIN